MSGGRYMLCGPSQSLDGDAVEVQPTAVVMTHRDGRSDPVYALRSELPKPQHLRRRVVLVDTPTRRAPFSLDGRPVTPKDIPADQLDVVAEIVFDEIDRAVADLTPDQAREVLGRVELFAAAMKDGIR